MDNETRHDRKMRAKRVAQHAEAQRAKGLVRVPVWVPVADKDRLIAYAAGLRIGAKLLLPSDRQTAALLRYGIDPSLESKTAPPGRTRQSTDTRDDDKPRRTRKRRAKKQPSDAKPAKKAKRKQEQNQPKTPKKRRNQLRRQAEKAARAKK